ncbi:MAG: sugar phosphate isomerase/epimerase, partial [Chloroflexota bacterium]|nr:sugar phosphate isomerase/epimerase [Chloroflexota bacterium]
QAAPPPHFALLVEGPVDSLDGADFDVTRDSDADRLVIDRLAELARRIGARAVNIHLISPGADPARLTADCHGRLLRAAEPFVRAFAELMHGVDATPTIENMPPVLRMRRQDFAFTPIGMSSADLNWMSERVAGLRVLVDTSHAGLYLNARSGAADADAAWREPLEAFLRQLPPEPPTVLGYVQQFGPHLANAQISNARGLLGEGLPYDEGALDLDPIIAWLGQHVEHIVTETLEASHDDAINMRQALRRMRAVLG